MWRIWSSARQVITWLGPNDKDILSPNPVFDRCFTGESGLIYTDVGTFEDPDLQCVCETNDDTAYPALEQAIAYSSRTKIQSEFVRARDVVVVAGSNSWSSEDFTPPEHTDRRPHFPSLRRLYAARQTWSALRDQTLEPRYSIPSDAPGVLSSFAGAIEGYVSTACFDSRERVFAMLSHPAYQVLDNERHLLPDYAISLEDLIFVVMERLDLLAMNWVDLGGPRGSGFPNTPHGAVDKIQKFLGNVYFLLAEALGLPTDSQGMWLNIAGWSDAADSLVLISGRRINCSGIVMRTFLRDVRGAFESKEVECSENHSNSAGGSPSVNVWEKVNATWRQEDFAKLDALHLVDFGQDISNYGHSENDVDYLSAYAEYVNGRANQD